MQLDMCGYDGMLMLEYGVVCQLSTKTDFSYKVLLYATKVQVTI